MSSDEIEYNAFYHILQNKYRKKYEPALSKCWMICIPCSAALRGIEITEEFVDLHILKPSPNLPCHHVSTDENSTYCYELDGGSLTLQYAPFPVDDQYIAKVLSVETGYNKEFQQYKILIIDKPLSPKFCPKPPDDDVVPLDKKITSLQDAMAFLSRFPSHVEFLTQLENELAHPSSSYTFLPDFLSTAAVEVRKVVSSHWVRLLQTHPLGVQRDARFQNLLTVALENYIVSRLHDSLFPVVCSKHKTEDEGILARVCELAAMGVTADQLGAPEDFAVPLPAAVVELASLDSLRSPVDKLSCLRTTLDLILAELKGAIVDAHSLVTVAGEGELSTPTTDDLIPLLMTVIIQAKPLHMASNLFYMENFQWTLSPNDAVSFSLVTFKVAVQELLSLQVGQLQPRSNKVHRELGIEELIKVTGEVGERFDRRGRRAEGPVSPLDRQMERLTAMIEASTWELRGSESGSGNSQEAEGLDRPALGEFLSSLQNNLGPCFGKQDEI